MVSIYLIYIFFLFSFIFEYSTIGLIINNVNTNKIVLTENDRNRYNPFSRKYFQDIRRRNNTENHFNTIVKKYPITRPTYIEELRRLNSKNVTIQTNSILGVENQFYDENDDNNNITIQMPTIDHLEYALF